MVLTYEVMNAPPSVRVLSFELTSPGRRGDLLSTLKVDVEAADPEGGEAELLLSFTGRETFQINLGEVKGRVHFQMEVWGNLTPGGWMMRAICVDRDGGLNATDWITFAVLNTPPEILSARVTVESGGALLTIQVLDPDLPPGQVLTLKVLFHEEVLFEGPVEMGESAIQLNLSSSLSSLILNVSDGYSCTTLTIPVTWPVKNATEEGSSSALPAVMLFGAGAALVVVATYIYTKKRRGRGER